MRALIFREVGRMALEDVEAPSPADGEVVVEVGACGICGSDLEGYLGSPGMRKRRVPPLLLGHEFSGIVAEDAEGWEGMPVAVHPLVTCGRCAACRSGRNYLCRKRALVGLHRPGAFAERVAVPATQLYPLPDGVPLWRGALVEPLAVGLHALELAGPVFRRELLVIGGGGIGFLVALAAKAMGAAVRVAELNESRRERIRALGVEVTEAAEGEAEATIDTVGSEATRRAAIEHVAPGGSAVFVGLHDDAHEFSFYPLILEEKKVQGTFTYSDGDFRRAVALCADIPEDYVTRMPLDRGAEAFEALARGEDYVKILLEPNGSRAAR